MYRITVTYGRPVDPDVFESHYREQHVPLVVAIPGLRRFTTTSGESLDANDAPWFLQADLYFDDKNAALAALSSEQGAAAAADIARFADTPPAIVGGDERVVHPAAGA